MASASTSAGSVVAPGLIAVPGVHVAKRRLTDQPKPVKPITASNKAKRGLKGK